jgi:DNA polymerase-3 subunit gamma/tau
VAAALYNRYRPRTFAEVVGQEHVTAALSAALESGRIHHAYLFSGPRGCGKTSSARILAASLNCIHGPTATPCGVCDECIGIRAGSSVDVVELDAASHGLVDDARDLRERTHYSPASGRYRVFVIDEAHQLGPGAANALLKVVEEPPPHVVFVFATTEPEKVLATIRSRTFSYKFRLVPPGVLREHLARICVSEGVEVEPEVLPLVVRAGGGSVRDSLSVLDQLIAGEATSLAQASALLGVTESVLLDDAVEALSKRDGAALFGVVERVVAAGHDPRRFAADLLERLRDLVLLQAVPEAAERGLVEGVAPDQLDRMQRQASSLGAAELSRAADVVHAGLIEMRGTTSPRLLLELVCARLLLPAADRSAASTLARLDAVERRISLGDHTGPALAAAPGLRPDVAAPRDRQPADRHAAERQTAERQTAERQTADRDRPGADRTVRPAPVAPEQSGPAPVRSEPIRSEPIRPESVRSEPVRSESVRSESFSSESGGPAPAGTDKVRVAPAGSANPAPATAAPAPVATASPGAPAPAASGAPAGRLDVAALQQAWPLILDAVKKRSRVPHAMLSQHAEVAEVDGDKVTIAIALPPIARQFQAGTGVDILGEAIAEVVGGRWRILVAPGKPAKVVDTPGGYGSGFAPGDEPEPEPDPQEPAQDDGRGGNDRPPPQEPPPREETNPVDLLKTAFGATIIAETDA